MTNIKTKDNELLVIWTLALFMIQDFIPNEAERPKHLAWDKLSRSVRRKRKAEIGNVSRGNHHGPK
jgi:hypothetical protein